MAPDSIMAALSGGDRRSIGNVDAVINLVARYPERFAELWQCLSAGDPVVRLRAADALEKISRGSPVQFEPYRAALIGGTQEDGSMEVRWHLIPIAARLALDPGEARGLYARLEDAVYGDRSRIVRVVAFQSAFELAERFPELRPAFERLVVYARAAPHPSLRARAKRIDIHRAPKKARASR
jgi:hypothetical protein